MWSGGELARAHDRLEHSHRRRPDRQHTFRLRDPLPRRRGDLVPLAVERVLLETGFGHRTKRVEPDVQGHPLGVQRARGVPA